MALLSGASLPLAFAPFDLYPVAYLAPAILFAGWIDARPSRAAWRGFLFGLGMFGIGVSWVYVSLHDYGNMPGPLAGLAVLLFVAFLASFPAAVGWLQGRLVRGHGTLHLVLVVPALWVLLEWVRTWIFTGFPWLHLGYSQIDTPLAGYASWIGVFGVSFACAASAGALLQAGRDRRHLWSRHVPIIALVWLGGWLGGKVEWTHPAGEPLPVALIQGNVPVTVKWVPEYRQSIIDLYLRLSMRAAGARLIVWPESAVPGYLSEIGPDLIPRLERAGKGLNADFVFGAVEKDERRRTYYNSAVSVGSRVETYRKQHLVPFGEFLPLKPVLGWLINYLHIPMSDFSAGPKDQAPLPAARRLAGVSICYEDAFGEEVIRMLPQATLLINLSEDAWFGRSLAPHQRLQMARMRAIESGRPMLRAANTGPSAVIDYHGEVVARSPEFRQYVLSASISPTDGVTPYVRFGNWPIISVLCMAVVLAWYVSRRYAVNGP